MTQPQARPTHGRLEVLPTAKRVRARVGARFVVDSGHAALLVVGHPRAYLVPEGDLDQDVVGRPSDIEQHDVYGAIRRVPLKVDGRTIEDALVVFEQDDGRGFDSDGRILVRWGKMDAWYEEEEEVFVHPRDPHTRIDTLLSARHVEVQIDSETVADTRRPVLLFETGLPVRYYVPQTDLRFDLLVESDKTTACPYKGFASYHHVQTAKELNEDIVWCYKAPFEEVRKVQGLCAFFDERCDVKVDGTTQARPKTSWSP